MSITSMEKNTSSNTQKRSYKCFTCNNRFLEPDTLIEHIASVHVDTLVGQIVSVHVGNENKETNTEILKQEEKFGDKKVVPKSNTNSAFHNADKASESGKTNKEILTEGPKNGS